MGEYSIADGDSQTEIIPVPNGGNLKVSFTSGDWDGEITFEIYDGSDTLVFSDGPEPTIGTSFTTLNTCPKYVSITIWYTKRSHV